VADTTFIYNTMTGRGGAYVAFPYDLRAELGKGRVKVSTTFDGEPYDGEFFRFLSGVAQATAARETR